MNRPKEEPKTVLIEDVEGMKPDRIQITPDDGAFYLGLELKSFADAAAILNLIAWMSARGGREVVSVDYSDGLLSVHLADG